MIRYEIREICGDWAIYEVRPDAEGEYTESELVLILNSRSNAEYVKAILEHEAQNPNAAVPYRPEVARMSDAECVAAFRFCCSDSYDCDECQFERMEGCGHMAICRRVLEMAERYLEHEKLITLMDEIRKVTREIAPNDEMSVSAQFMLLERETLWDKVERLERVEKDLDRLRAIFKNFMIVNSLEKPERLYPTDNTSRQDLYRAVLLVQQILGLKDTSWELRMAGMKNDL